MSVFDFVRAMFSHDLPPEPERADPPRRKRIGTPALPDEATAPDAFRPYQPMPGVMPSGMAMDSACGGASVAQMAAYAAATEAHEGIGFLGYPYLAELSQRGEYRKIASIWAEHCTRKWIEFSGDEEKVAAIEAEFERLGVRQMMRRAVELECIFGRIQIYADCGDADTPGEIASPLALRPEKINQAHPLRRLSIVEPLWSYPAMYESANPLSADFYRPQSWFVSGAEVHASRLMTLVGNEVPNMLKPAYAFGGVSMIQMAKPYIDNWLRARQSVSDLMHAFSIINFKTDLSGALQGGGWSEITDRVQTIAAYRDNRDVYVTDKDTETIEINAVPLSGLDKLQAQAQEQMSSITGIPLVVLLGVTPSGLNASSEGEIRIFYDAITAYNNRVILHPIQTICKMVQLSLFGEIDDDISVSFVPLWEMSDRENADIRLIDAQIDQIYTTSGIVDADEVRERLREDDSGIYRGVDLDSPADVPPDAENKDADLGTKAGKRRVETPWRNDMRF